MKRRRQKHGKEKPRKESESSWSSSSIEERIGSVREKIRALKAAGSLNNETVSSPSAKPPLPFDCPPVVPTNGFHSHIATVKIVELLEVVRERDVELAEVQSRATSLEEKLQQAMHRDTVQRKELKEAQVVLESVERIIADQQMQINTLRNSLKESESALASARSASLAHMRDGEATKQEVESLQTEVLRWRAAEQEWTLAMEKLHRQVELSQREERRLDAKCHEVERELLTANIRVNELHKEVQRGVQDHSVLSAEVASLRLTVKDLEHDLERERKKVVDAEDVFETTKEASESTVLSLRKEVAEVWRRAKNAEARRAEVERQLQHSQEQTERYATRYHDATEETKELRREYHTVADELEEQRNFAKEYLDELTAFRDVPSRLYWKHSGPSSPENRSRSHRRILPSPFHQRSHVLRY